MWLSKKIYEGALWFLLITLILLFIVFPSNAKELPRNESKSSIALEDANGFKEWIALDGNLKTMTGSVIKFILPTVLDNMGKLNLSSQCQKDSLLLISGVKHLKEWAIQLIDSSGKMIDGFLQGKVYAMGDYGECTSIVATKTVTEVKKNVLFKGQYCIIRALPQLPEKKNILKLKNGLEQYTNFTKSVSDITKVIYNKAEMFRNPFLSLTLGICVPSGCSSEDVNEFVGRVGQKFMMNATVERCEVKQETIFDRSFIIAVTFYTLAAILVLLGSLLELYTRKHGNKFKSIGLRALLSFSLMKNFKKLADTNVSKGTFTCLHGIRFLTMSWIVISHATLFTFILSRLSGNLNDLPKVISRYGMQILCNGFLAVDTFFFISGLVNAYTRIKEMKEKPKQTSMVLLLILRLWRILPVLFFSILFIPLFENAISGPLKTAVLKKSKENCEKRWWTTLLFIQNLLYNYEDMCLPQAWFLACDFQLFIVALFTVNLFLKRPKLGVIVNGLLIIASAVYAGTWIKIFNVPPTFIFHVSSMMRRGKYKKMYYTPFIHAGPYFIGVLTGYFLATNKAVKIPKKMQVVGWTLSVCLALSSLIGTKSWNSGNEPSELESVLYGSFSKIAFTIAISWTLICCVTGHGGIVNKILSWSAWVPLSRLTFTSYLLSPIIQFIYIANSKTGFSIDILVLIWRSIGDLFFSLLAALGVSLLVEAPCLSLENIIKFRDRKETNKITKSIYTNNAFEAEANSVTRSAENKL